MNAAAEAVMKELPDLVLAYGNSDEFGYVYLHCQHLHPEPAFGLRDIGEQPDEQCRQL
jgi:hypothetical protein